MPLSEQNLNLPEKKLNRGVSKPGVPHFFGKGPDCVVDPLGMFLVGACHRPRKRKRTNREKSQTGQKRKNRDGRVQIGKTPHLNPPPPKMTASQRIGTDSKILPR